MRSVAASLAAVLVAALGACGGGGAEPGASREATLVLDFQPNAVHAGIYTALAAGEYERRGVELTVREPSSSTDAPKLLATGRADFAVLDINDLGIARERGIDVVGVAAIVQRPLASVIAADRSAIRRPRDLEGGTVGVTGLPSDDAVLDSLLEADGADPAQVDRVTIGFDSVAALSAGRLDAATAFWNAEGVALKRLDVPTREFRIDEFAAPRYPELVVATEASTLGERPRLVTALRDALRAGYERVLDDPQNALENLLAAVPELAEAEQRAQLDALLDARAFEPPGALPVRRFGSWQRWALLRGIISRPAPNLSVPLPR